MAPELWFWAIGWILTAFVTGGNGIVIYLIVTRRNLRTTTNVFVASLAAADFGLGATYMPLLASACDLDSSCGGGLVRQSLFIFFIFSSMFNLCALTMDRYTAIVNPLRYVKFSSRLRVLLLACAAGVAPMFILAPFLAIELAATDEAYDLYSKCFYALLCAVETCVGVAWVLATLRILRIARTHVRRNAVLLAQLNFNHRLPRLQAGPRLPQEAMSARIICILVSVFIIYICADIFSNVSYILSFEPGFVFLDVLSLLMLVNSAINPIAFAFFKKDIKRELTRWFSRIRGERRIFIEEQLNTEASTNRTGGRIINPRGRVASVSNM